MIELRALDLEGIKSFDSALKPTEVFVIEASVHTKLSDRFQSPVCELKIDGLNEGEISAVKNLTGNESIFFSNRSEDSIGRAVELRGFFGRRESENAMYLKHEDALKIVSDFEKINTAYISAGFHRPIVHTIIMDFLRFAAAKNLGIFCISDFKFRGYE